MRDKCVAKSTPTWKNTAQKNAQRKTRKSSNASSGIQTDGHNIQPDQLFTENNLKITEDMVQLPALIHMVMRRVYRKWREFCNCLTYNYFFKQAPGRRV